MGLFEKRRSNIGISMLWGVGGLLVGAGVAAALTPFTGTQLRGLVRELMLKSSDDNKEEKVDNQLDRMENEGGVSHEVDAPLAGRFETHS
jgi:hypothetical protein